MDATAIEIQLDAVNIACRIAGEEGDDVRHLLGRPDPPERTVLRQRLNTALIGVLKV